MDAEMWDERYSSTEYVWSVTPNQFVEAHLAELTPGDAIDVAAGEGRNAVWLASLGWSVTAVDFSSVALDKGRRLAADHDAKVEFVCADATTYEPSEQVDLVVLSYFQIDKDIQTTVLEHAKGWLRPGGTMFVIAHDQTNVTDGYGGPPSVDVCYSVERTVAALSGLDVTTSEVAERAVNTPEGPKVALDTLVIATRPNP
ncbi:MAG: class I SAM-dependent methyltransferase [Acidimicrobiales bacterium]